MANLTLTNDFPAGIYRIEQDDYATGGENGLSNLQAKQLGARTNFLKSEVDEIKTDAQVIVGSVEDQNTALSVLAARAGSPAGVRDLNESGSGRFGLDAQHNGTVICIRDGDGYFLSENSHVNFPISEKAGGTLGQRTGHITIIAFAATSLGKNENVTVYYAGDLPEGFTNTYAGAFFIDLNPGDRADIYLSGTSWFWHVTSNK